MLAYNRVVLMGVVETDLQIMRKHYDCKGYFLMKIPRSQYKTKFDFLPISNSFL